MAEKYEKLAEEAAARVEVLRRNDSLVFPIFTDIHINSVNDAAASELLDAMEALSDRIPADGVLALGDNPDMLGRTEHASNEKIHGVLQGLLDRVASRWQCPLFAINGNHDGIGTDFFDAEFWYSVVGNRYDWGMANRDKDGHSAYYYVDFPASRVRIVFLSLPCGSRLTAEDPTPLWEYGREQLRWLAQTALNTSLSVLIAAHVPFYYDYYGDRTKKLGVFNGTIPTETFISALCGWIADRPAAQAIFEAFRNHTAYDNGDYGIRMRPSAPEAELIGFISGHIHTDSLWQPGECRPVHDDNVLKERCNSLPCVQLVVSASNIRINSVLRKQAKWPVCMDIAVISPSERRFSTVRYGDGEDRTFTW